MAQHDRNGRITGFNFHFFTIMCYISRVEANQRFRFSREFLNPNKTIAGLGRYSGPPISGGAERRPSYAVFQKKRYRNPFGTYRSQTTLGDRSCTAEAGGGVISVKPGASVAGDVTTAGVPVETEELAVGAEVARLRTAVFDTRVVGSARGH